MDQFANSKFVEKLTVFGGKIGANKYIQAISSGMMMLIPVVIIGSFAGLFLGIKVEAWQTFLASTKLNTILTLVVNATTNMLGLYFTYGIARSFAESEKLRSKIVPIFAVISYLALLPMATLEDGTSYLSYNYLGTKGVVVGMLVAIVTVLVYGWVERRNWVIKMPSGTPDYVSQSFAALIPGAIQILVIVLVNLIIGLTNYPSIFDLIYSLLQLPVTALVGGSLVPNTIVQMLTQLSWGLGVHPGYISSLMGPILMTLNVENQAAFATGSDLPNIITLSFSYIMTVATLYPAIATSILLVAKSQRLRGIGKVSIVPAIFGISEPLIFGLPIVFNPIIWIPWMITPVINFIIGYLLTSIGLVARTSGVLVFNMPLIITGILNGHYSIALLEIALFLLDIAIFAPFILVMDKKYRREEGTL
ncbi:PTS sugar transporter subunit IIC [Streptococcus moroccensis]